MMQVQKFLREGGTLSALLNTRAIKANRSAVHPSLVLLKYNQIDSPMADPIVQECRGVILDESDDWRVVSRSFSKFFNAEEVHAAPIDWSTAVVQEKLDGSLCVLYFHAGKWRVQTSGHPDAAGQVGGEPFTFADLFWKTFAEHDWRLPGDGLEHLCIAFELMTKWNRVVVMHSEPRLRMIGVRNRDSGDELPLSAMAHLYEPVRAFPLRSLGDIVETFARMEPLKQEGYVVVDGKFNRIKVKHPGYVAIHHLKDGCSRRRLTEIVQAGEVGEFLSYFPEWTEEFQAIQGGVAALVAELEREYERIKGAATQKDFALEAVNARCSAALFMLRAGKVGSIREFIEKKMRADHLLTAIGMTDSTYDVAE